MLALPANIRLFLAERPVDFRGGFDSLVAIVENQFGLSALSGHVFIFLSKRGNQIRLLFWDRDGFCLVTKRLEAGTFRRVRRSSEGSSHIEIDAAELVLLIEGVEVQEMRRRKRYSHRLEEKVRGRLENGLETDTK